MNEKETIDFIESKGKFGIRLGLESIALLLEKLGNPHLDLKTIHVAGTNGKGSVCTMLSKILTCAGYTVGTYTSPALEVFNERVRLNTVPISGEDLVAMTDQVKMACEALVAEGHPHPTGFEIETALAFLYFKNKKTDICVVEVGMGGRLDATNILPAPIVCVLMSISLDHMDYLGDTLEAIAAEKAAIIKPGSAVVAYPQAPSVIDVFKTQADAVGAHFQLADPNVLTRQRESIDGQILTYTGGELSDLSEFKLSLLGHHQLNNTAVVLKAVAQLRTSGYQLPGSAIEEALANVVFPGRFEVLHQDPVILIDGAHNPGGIAAFVENIGAYFPGQKMNLYFGMLEDKDIETALSLLMPLTEAVHTLTPESDRAMPAEKMATHIRELYQLDVNFYETIAEAVASLDLSDPTRLNVFVGSLYMIGVVRTELKKRIPIEDY
ncbi:MAG: bifunctional folylpolyglutamate synthase/dihydrofolate synthase [Eubacteriaceae bacterium]|jgi:dihydrofolate synthase/folylpolyglutamate synthase|nr:bifunctional folylpolyglutamate synthase/dihydrofolate synthase [Eubacteriaceae bacterium]